MSAWRSGAHLVKRFVGSLSSAAPAPADERWAQDQLVPGEVALWRRMSNVDRCHAIKVAQRFIDVRATATRDEIAAALLHDIGKLESNLGTLARVAATVVGPRTERFRRYHDHERIGAEMLRCAGSASATVDLVQRRGPASEALARADDT